MFCDCLLYKMEVVFVIYLSVRSVPSQVLVRSYDPSVKIAHPSIDP